MKRVFLFLATNLVIVIVLSISLRVLGVEQVLDVQGAHLDLRNLLVLAFVFGMGVPFKHVVPSGTYFLEDRERAPVQNPTLSTLPATSKP